MHVKANMNHHTRNFQFIRRVTSRVIGVAIIFMFLLPSCTPTPQTTGDESRSSAVMSPVTLKPVSSVRSMIPAEP